ncbi:hypothetical protein [Desulfogranum mediterraneum]|uniref:hypothetical protein n=1 Tax=Desulfogranum mediterraneum TaxID=160661 RepID=UPI0003F7B7F2|nr:hypothetical protein [Desulfogranum mediterraneum]
MKQNLMRAPLLKAGAVLLIFMLLVYLTGTSAEGSVWGAIAALVVGAIHLVQWAIGMVIGLAVCLAVLFGIFLGAAAMVNRESSAEMYQALIVKLKTWLAEGLASVAEIKAGSAQQAGPDSERETVVASELHKVDEVHKALDNRLEELSAKIHALEAKMAAFVPHDKLKEVAEEVKTSGSALDNLHEVLAGLETKIEDAAAKLKEVSSEKLLGDLPHRLSHIEQKDVASKEDIKPLVDLVERLQLEVQDSIAGIAQSHPEEEVGAAAAEEEHRLFSYFEDTADQERIAALVEETLQKDMTYAQVMNHLVKEMGAEKGQIISDHPSLAKDYIRQCRRG